MKVGETASFTGCRFLCIFLLHNVVYVLLFLYMLQCYQSRRKRLVPIFRMKDGKEICNLDSAEGKREYRRRTLEMRTRQNELCLWCGEWMPENDSTFDHEFGRGAGKHDDRVTVNGRQQNAALHGQCNGDKGSRLVPYPFAPCIRCDQPLGHHCGKRCPLPGRDPSQIEPGGFSQRRLYAR